MPDVGTSYSIAATRRVAILCKGNVTDIRFDRPLA